MNVIRLLLLCLVSFLFILPANDAQARAKSYPLVCRGGGTMEGRFGAWKANKGFFSLIFVGAKQGSDVRPPQAGECAWLDRGFLPGEPQRLHWDTDDMKSMQFQFGPQGIHMAGASNGKFLRVVNSILMGQLFRVHAYRGQCPGDKCNVLTVTEVN
ncbi:MAG: hypothetical protein AB7T38_06490 [Nitrospirales bacterium]